MGNKRKGWLAVYSNEQDGYEYFICPNGIPRIYTGRKNEIPSSRLWDDPEKAWYRLENRVLDSYRHNPRLIRVEVKTPAFQKNALYTSRVGFSLDTQDDSVDVWLVDGMGDPHYSFPMTQEQFQSVTSILASKLPHTVTGCAVFKLSLKYVGDRGRVK